MAASMASVRSEAETEAAVSTAWGENALALRRARRRGYGWLTTPKEVLQRARLLDARAVSSLVATYRQPMRRFLSRHGVAWDQTEDVTQGYFEGVVRRNNLAQVDPTRSFRAWLRSGALHFLYNERDREHTLKRQLNEDTASELRAELEAERVPSAERLLDGQRAKELVDKAWARLRPEYERIGQQVLFDHLKKTLLLEATETTDAELCRALGQCTSYVAVARHRLRNEELPAAIMAELKVVCARPRAAGTPTRTLREELQSLLDALT